MAIESSTVILAAGTKEATLEKIVTENLAAQLKDNTALKSVRGTLPKQLAGVHQAVVTAALGSDQIKDQRLVSAAAQRFGVDRRRIQAALDRRKLQNASSWGQVYRKRRSDSLSDEIKAKVQDFWRSPKVARESSSSKHVVTKQHNGERIQARLFWQECTNLEVYKKFRKDHPTVQVGLRSFEKLKPWNVRRKQRQVSVA
jgi:hypothetical protein